MPATKSSRASRSSKPRRGGRSDANATGAGWAETGVAVLLLAMLGSFAAWFFWSRGYSTWYGDAEAHLNIARRIVDSGQPGYDQIGTVWLPVPHLLMALFARTDSLWFNGLAGTIPGVVCYVLGGTLLFLAARRIFGDLLAAFTTTAVFALNPNLLYLQSAPMTEPVFFAALMAMLYGTVLVRQTGSFAGVLIAALGSLGASLTRYEGWVLIPAVFLFLLIASPERRVLNALVFGVLASLGPIWWIGHNWWFYGDAFYFYYGPDSARGIYQRALNQGMARYPGDQDWAKAIQYVTAASLLATGRVLVIAGAIGAVAALARRHFWPVIFLLLPPAFYVLSMHGSGTPIFVPHLWPFSYYNTRYGLSMLPLAALGVGALIVWIPGVARGIAVAVAVIGVSLPWFVPMQMSNLITWKESQVNSEQRRAWTNETADYLLRARREGERIRMPFGDMTGILRKARIPLRETIHEGDSPWWDAGIARPDFFLQEPWILCQSGDPLCSAVIRTLRQGNRYERVKVVNVKGAKPVEIWYRNLEPRPPAPPDTSELPPEEGENEDATVTKPEPKKPAPKKAPVRSSRSRKRS
jgi:hypothetical protein